MHDQTNNLAARSAERMPEARVARDSCGRFTRFDAFAAVIIVLAAMSLRAMHLSAWRANPTFDRPIVDEAYHDQWARAIISGERFIDGPCFRAPAYPYLLAGIYTLFSNGYLAARIIQSMIGALSCGLVY